MTDDEAINILADDIYAEMTRAFVRSKSSLLSISDESLDRALQMAIIKSLIYFCNLMGTTYGDKFKKDLTTKISQRFKNF